MGLITPEQRNELNHLISNEVTAAMSIRYDDPESRARYADAHRAVQRRLDELAGISPTPAPVGKDA